MKNKKNNRTQKSEMMSITEQFEHKRKQMLDDGMAETEAIIKALLYIDSQMPKYEKKLDEFAPQFADLFKHVVSNYASTELFNMMGQQWQGRYPQVFQQAGVYIIRQDKAEVDKYYEEAPTSVKHNIETIVEYIWGLRTKTVLLSNAVETEPVYILNRRYIKEEDVSKTKDSIRQFVSICCMRDRNLIVESAKSGSRNIIQYTLFGFICGNAYIGLPKPGEVVPLRDYKGDLCPVRAENCLTPKLKFQNTDNSWRIGDVFKGIEVSKAPDGFDLVEQFGFYRAQYQKGGLNKVDSEIAAIAHLEDIAYETDDDVLDSMADQYIELYEYLMNSVLYKNLKKKISEIWVNGEPYVFVLANDYLFKRDDKKEKDAYTQLPDALKNGISMLVEHIMGIRAERLIVGAEGEYLNSLDIPQEVEPDELDDYKKELRQTMVLSFTAGNPIVLRTTTDNGETYHFNGFYADGGAIKVLMPNELANVARVYEIQGRKNGFFEAAPMLFPKS